MPTQITALVEFAERIRRIAYGNPVYYGIERAAGRPCRTTEATDKRTLKRCRDFHLAEPISVRATFVRLPMGDSLTLSFVDEHMNTNPPVKWIADEIVRVVFGGAKPERTELNPPWVYFLKIGRAEESPSAEASHA